MMSSNLGAGYALVPQQLDWNVNEGGGPTRLAPGSNPVYAHAGNNVWRTPHLVVKEAEPGAEWPGIMDRMFLPDGRLVPNKPIYTDDMFQGAGEVVTMTPVGSRSSGFIGGLRSLVPAAAMFAGGAIGYKAAEKRKVWGAIGGALAGGILGAIFK